MKRSQFLAGTVVGLALVAGCSDDTHSPTVHEQRKATIAGTFIVESVPAEINGVPASGAFAHLVGKVVSFAISFDEIEKIHFQNDPPPDRMVELVSGPVTVSFTGDPGLARDIAPVFEGQRFKFSMTDEVILTDFIGFVMAGTSSERYSFEISVFYGGTLDEDGYPELEDFSEELGEATLRRFGAGEGDPMTDYAIGSASVSFTGTEDLVGN